MAATVTLTAADQARFAAALEALLSPLAHPDPDAWRREVNRRLVALIDAESAAFDLSGPDGMRSVYSEEYPDPVPDEYVAMHRPMNERYGLNERFARHGVLTKQEIWASAWGEYLRSPYRNEFLTPYRMYQGIGIGTRLEATAGPAMAVIILMRNTPTAPPLAEREKSLLQMLLPAFRAGVSVGVRHAGLRGVLAGALDRLGSALAVVDLSGHTLHRTPGLQALLQADPESARIAAAIAAAARGVARVQQGARLASPGPSPAHTVATAHGRYRVRATALGEGRFGPDPVALVLVESTPAAAAWPSEAELRERFGLTRQEARVALLLAERRTTAEIAAALYISPHTARHHAEHVLGKLGVASRNDVAAALAGDAGTRDAHG